MHCIVQSVSVCWPECLSLCKASTFVFAVLAYLSPLSIHPQMKQKGGLNKWKWCKRKPNVRKQVVSVTCLWHQHLKDAFIPSTSWYNACFSWTFTFFGSHSILLSFSLTLQIFLWIDCVCERIRNKTSNELQEKLFYSIRVVKLTSSICIYVLWPWMSYEPGMSGKGRSGHLQSIKAKEPNSVTFSGWDFTSTHKRLSSMRGNFSSFSLRENYD